MQDQQKNAEWTYISPVPKKSQLSIEHKQENQSLLDSFTEKKGNATNEKEADILEVIIQKTENSESFIVDDKLQENDESFLLNIS